VAIFPWFSTTAKKVFPAKESQSAPVEPLQTRVDFWTFVWSVAHMASMIEVRMSAHVAHFHVAGAAVVSFHKVRELALVVVLARVEFKGLVR